MYVWGSDEVLKNFKLFCGALLLCTTYFFKVNPFNIFLKISYFTGEILVHKILDIYTIFQDILLSTSLFLEVVQEDGLVFLKDVVDKIIFVSTVLRNIYAFLEKAAEICWIYIISGFEKVCGAIELTYDCLKFVHFTITAVKQSLNNIGSFTWNFIAQLPETAINIFRSVIDFVKNTNYEITSLILLFIDSLIQFFFGLFYIPLNSLCGLLISAILLLIFCLKIKVIWSGISKLCHSIANVAETVWSGRFLENKSHSNNIEENNEENLDERLCVICQFSLKEVILFPCRHLCLCWECSVTLSKVQHTCPICRSYIRDTLKVYL